MTTSDFIYTTWFDTPPLNPKVGEPPDNTELHDPANVFLSNMGRVEALGQLPYALVYLGIAKGHADMLARSQGKDVNEIATILDGQPAWVEGVQSAAKGLAGQAANSSEISVRKGYQALVASILVTSYGSLETLMIDVCTVAIKLRPGRFPKLEKKIANGCIGRKNLKELRQQYEQMFPEEAGKAPHGLSSEFASSYQCLLVLEAARQVFAHRCGIVDARFLERMKTSPALGKLKVGEELFFDFKNARAFAGVTRDFGVYLVKFVDWWLNTHPA